MLKTTQKIAYSFIIYGYGKYSWQFLNLGEKSRSKHMTSIGKYCVLEQSSYRKRKGTYMTMLYPSRCPHPHTSIVSSSHQLALPQPSSSSLNNCLMLHPGNGGSGQLPVSTPKPGQPPTLEGKKPSSILCSFPKQNSPKQCLCLKKGWAVDRQVFLLTQTSQSYPSCSLFQMLLWKGVGIF